MCMRLRVGAGQARIAGSVAARQRPWVAGAVRLLPGNDMRHLTRGSWSAGAYHARPLRRGGCAARLETACCTRRTAHKAAPPPTRLMPLVRLDAFIALCMFV